MNIEQFLQDENTFLAKVTTTWRKYFEEKLCNGNASEKNIASLFAEAQITDMSAEVIVFKNNVHAMIYVAHVQMHDKRVILSRQQGRKVWEVNGKFNSKGDYISYSLEEEFSLSQEDSFVLNQALIEMDLDGLALQFTDSKIVNNTLVNLHDWEKKMITDGVNSRMKYMKLLGKADKAVHGVKVAGLLAICPVYVPMVAWVYMDSVGFEKVVKSKLGSLVFKPLAGAYKVASEKIFNAEEGIQKRIQLMENIRKSL